LIAREEKIGNPIYGKNNTGSGMSRDNWLPFLTKDRIKKGQGNGENKINHANPGKLAKRSNLPADGDAYGRGFFRSKIRVKPSS